MARSPGMRKDRPESYRPIAVPRGIRKIVEASLVDLPHPMTNVVPSGARLPRRFVQTSSSDEPKPAFNRQAVEDMEVQITNVLAENELRYAAQITSEIVFAESA